MGLALGVGWIGYTLSYFGWCSLRGAGVGLMDLVVPGRTVVIPAGGTKAAPPKSQVNPAAGGKSGYSTLPLPKGPGIDPKLVA